jgi:hypothetical protein
MTEQEQERMLRVLRDHGCKEGQSPEVSFALGWAVGVIVKRAMSLNPNYEGVDEPEREGAWKGTKNKGGY